MIQVAFKDLSRVIRAFAPAVVVGMPMRNAERTVVRAVTSVLDQVGVDGGLLLVVMDDGSTDGSVRALGVFSSDPRIVIAQGRWGAAWRVRNALLDAVDEAAPTCRLICRLDADDVLWGPHVLRGVVRELEQLTSYPGRGRRVEPVAWLGGNALEAGGQRLGRVNLADTRLATKRGVYERLLGMSSGDASAELPSCNLALRPGLGVRYAPVVSAEDHWLVAGLLSRFAAGVRLAPDALYCAYSLTGALTQENKALDGHRLARARLFSAWCAHADRMA